MLRKLFMAVLRVIMAEGLDRLTDYLFGSTERSQAVGGRQDDQQGIAVISSNGEVEIVEYTSSEDYILPWPALVAIMGNCATLPLFTVNAYNHELPGSKSLFTDAIVVTPRNILKSAWYSEKGVVIQPIFGITKDGVSIICTPLPDFNVSGAQVGFVTRYSFGFDPDVDPFPIATNPLRYLIYERVKGIGYSGGQLSRQGIASLFNLFKVKGVAIIAEIDERDEKDPLISPILIRLYLLSTENSFKINTFQDLEAEGIKVDLRVTEPILEGLKAVLSSENSGFESYVSRTIKDFVIPETLSTFVEDFKTTYKNESKVFTWLAICGIAGSHVQPHNFVSREYRQHILFQNLVVGLNNTLVLNDAYAEDVFLSTSFHDYVVNGMMNRITYNFCVPFKSFVDSHLYAGYRLDQALNVMPVLSEYWIGLFKANLVTGVPGVLSDILPADEYDLVAPKSIGDLFCYIDISLKWSDRGDMSSLRVEIAKMMRMLLTYQDASRSLFFKESFQNVFAPNTVHNFEKLYTMLSDCATALENMAEPETFLEPFEYYSKIRQIIFSNYV